MKHQRTTDGGAAIMPIDGSDDQITEVLTRIVSDGVETVRFLFSDQHGILRGKTLVASAAESAFRKGLSAPSSLLLKDISHRTVFPVWGTDAGFGEGILTGAGDLLLKPDPLTYRRLPWSSHSAWVLCDVMQSSGAPIPFAPRTVLRTALDRLHGHGLDMVCGLEIEFHIFRITDDGLTHPAGGMPGTPRETAPLNHGYQLLTETTYGACEEILDELRRSAQELGLPVNSTEIEFGPSQFEFTFDPASAWEHADNLIMFRTMAKEVCARRGLHATFMCRPVVANAAASGWHIHQSIVELQSGLNCFMPVDTETSPMAGHWIAGLLEHAAESCLLTTPTVNGYRRFQPNMLAPDRIQWARDNKGAMLRALFNQADPASRVENRVAEPAANPHYVLAAQILAGLDGIERKLKPPAPVDLPYDSSAQALPQDLGAAIDAFKVGGLFSGTLGTVFKDYMIQLKSAEWRRYLSTLSEWEHREYAGAF